MLSCINVKNTAHTFMHELGHTLGLDADHCYKDTLSFNDDKNQIGKPDYPSCMSYNPNCEDLVDYSNVGSKDDTITVYKKDPKINYDPPGYETIDNFYTNDWENLRF